MCENHQIGKTPQGQSTPDHLGGSLDNTPPRRAMSSRYRRERDLPRLLGVPATRLPPPGPDYTLRLLARLSALAVSPFSAMPGWPRPAPAVVRTVLQAELGLISRALSNIPHK